MFRYFTTVYITMKDHVRELILRPYAGLVRQTHFTRFLVFLESSYQSFNLKRLFDKGYPSSSSR